MADITVTVERSAVVLDRGPEGRLVLPAAWLRSACACPACRDAGNGQNLLDPADLDPALAPGAAEIAANGSLAVRWAPDGHQSRYDVAWLAGQAPSAEARARRRPRPLLWGRELEADLPRGDHAAVVDDPAALYRFLAHVRDRGFAILSGVPCRDAEVERVAALFWYVRETNYGRHFDVIAKPDPENLAYTPRGLAAHTDNPYADPVPGLQLLHCLEQSEDGGDNILVDGFAAAERLRRERPAAFATLARVPVLYRFADQTADLRALRPVIACDAEGRLRAIHVNDRAFHGPDADTDDAACFYDAYRAFGALLRSPESEVRVRLAPGDVLIMDNRRTLHGRKAYRAAGRRHLQGCYVDAGGLASKLRVLARTIGHDVADAGLAGADREHDAADRVLGILTRHGGDAYLGEPVTQLEHALQSAHAAELANAPKALVVAALLHDIGHFLHDLPEDCALHGLDSRHEDVGGAFLARCFGPEVAEPVRLHVDAKRYLAATESWYDGLLSDASKLSLRLQGGPLDEASARAFDARPYARDAVALRRWDEAGKVAGAQTPDLRHYRPLVIEALRPDV
ncbi:MAG: TauD/TfdA family dioxygenase [Alphaproteobacteria bacterium]